MCTSDSSVDQWCFVSSKENPADDASRGLDARKKASDSRLFNGPSLLWEAEAFWSNEDHSVDPTDNDVEVKSEGRTNIVQISSDVFPNVETSWSKVRRIVGYVLLYKRKLLNQDCGKNEDHSVTCRCFRGNLQIQKMASLPKDRMCEEPPFTYCGVDLFGSIVVKERHK